VNVDDVGASCRGTTMRLEDDGDAALVHHAMTEEAVPGVLACLLALRDRPTAVLAAADFLALAALKAARAGGLRVPDDLSIAAFDDSLLVQHADPPLTAVSQSKAPSIK